MANTDLLGMQGVNEHVSNLVASVAPDQNYIADLVLPIITTRSANVTYRKFGNDHLAAVTAEDDLRAPGAMPNMIDTNWSTADVVLDEHMLGAAVDIQELAAGEASGPGGADDVRMAKLITAKSGVLLAKEAAAAALIFDAGNYSGRTVSNIDWGATGLRQIVMNAANTVMKLGGLKPNTLIMGADVAVEVMNNADLLSAFQNGGLGEAADLNAVARFLGVERVLVGNAVTQTKAAAGDAGTASYVWTSDSVAYIYAPNGASKFTPSFGFQFRGQYGFGGTEFAKVIEKNELIEKWGYGQHYKYVGTFVKSGYLWTDALDT